MHCLQMLVDFGTSCQLDSLDDAQDGVVGTPVHACGQQRRDLLMRVDIHGARDAQRGTLQLEGRRVFIWDTDVPLGHADQVRLSTRSHGCMCWR